jgi:hypothetical protein
MSPLLGPILAVALLSQFSDGPLKGTVVDDAGKPVDGAQVVFHGPTPMESKIGPVEVRATTNAGGEFQLALPAIRRLPVFRAQVWAFRPGLAITASGLDELTRPLMLRKAGSRTVKIERPDGQPIVGARVTPRSLLVGSGGSPDSVPESLAEPLAVTTGPDGKATLTYLAAGNTLVAVRITADSIGTQDSQIVDRPGRERQGAAITIRLKPTSRLAGRVRTRAGEPVVGQTVEVWFRGGTWLRPNPVVFKNGPIRTTDDGSFQTPDNLLVGSAYRLVVRAPGKETILSDWITIGDKPRVLLPMLQRPLRTVRGQVVDRQRTPIAGIEVFQSGDGPEWTSTRTGADGRFALRGFHEGPVFVFARGEGYRFFGRLVKAAEHDITLELTRTSERPAHEMRMLPEVIPLAESRTLARRLIEPYLRDFEHRSLIDKNRVLLAFAQADPTEALRTLEEARTSGLTATAQIKSEIVRALARTDPGNAEAVAEAIEVPDIRATALLAVCDALPASQRDHKLALLNRVSAQIKAGAPAAMPLYQLGEAAERWYELGEKEKAKALFADGLRLANEMRGKPNSLRGSFAAGLARVDLSSGLAIAKEFPDSRPYPVGWVLRNIAFRLAADDPVEAERVLRQIKPEMGQDWLPGAIAWKMATVDPTRARRLVEESQRHWEHPELNLFLALGLKARDPAAARQAFEIAMRGIDRLSQAGAGYSRELAHRDILLPLVEQIDPALVAEYFWRVVAARPPLGNPRPISEAPQRNLVLLLAWYDRVVAEALFEPIRERMEHGDDPRPAGRAVDFLAWSLFDPRAAVDRLVQVPVVPQARPGVDTARGQVSETLSLPYEDRWRQIWGRFTEMGGLWERDLMW